MTQVKIKRILAVLPRFDSPGDSIGYAKALAEGWQAELDVLHFCPGDEDRDLTEARRQQLTQRWQNGSDVPIGLYSVVAPDLSEALTQFQAERPFDLVVKAEHHSQLKLTADWQLLRNIPVPVILLTERPRQTRKRLCRSLAMLRTKKLENPWRKHGNIPL